MAAQNSKFENRTLKLICHLRFRISNVILRTFVLAWLIWVIWPSIPAHAQDVAWGRKSCPPCPPSPPVEKPALDLTPEQPPSAVQPSAEPLLGPERAALLEVKPWPWPRPI